MRVVQPTIIIMSDICSTCTEKFRVDSTMESLAGASPIFWERMRSSLAENASAGCKLCRALLAFDMKAEAAKPLRDGRQTAEQYLQHVKADPLSKVDFTFSLGSRRPSTLTVELGFGLFGGHIDLRVSTNEGIQLMPHKVVPGY